MSRKDKRDPYTNSNNWLRYARGLTPGGAQTRSKMAQGFVERAFPAFASQAMGPYLFDIDGHRYIDYLMACGAVGLGYCHPDINLAIHLQLAHGVSFSLPTTVEADLAEKLLEHVAPWADQVRFVKTGSEATEAAVRIARINTGRDFVVSIGYHGWHSVQDAASPSHPGVPESIARLYEDWPYGQSLPAVFLSERRSLPAEQIAAVLIEPAVTEAPPPGYLAGLREWCDRYGALLIFDEVVTGYRWRLGGVSQDMACGDVVPDLACYGKAMANGFPLACVVGSERLMQDAAMYVSGTFGGEALSLVAALATLDIYVESNAVDRIWEAGAHLRDEFNGVAATLSASFPIRIAGAGCRLRFEVGDGRPYNGHMWTSDERRFLMSLFLQEAAAEGVLFHPASILPSAIHTMVKDEAIAACSKAMQTVLEKIGDGEPNAETILKGLKGLPSRPVFDRMRGTTNATR